MASLLLHIFGLSKNKFAYPIRSLWLVSTNHLKMLQCLHDCLFFLRRTLGNSLSLGLGQIIVLPDLQPTFPLDLGDIQAGHLQPKLLQYIRLDFVIGGLALGGGQIHLAQVQVNLDMMLCPEFGQ